MRDQNVVFGEEGLRTFWKVTVTAVALLMFCGVALVIQKVFAVGAGGDPAPAVNPEIPLWLWIDAALDVKLNPVDPAELLHGSV